MHTLTTVRSWPAMATALSLAAATVRLLIDDWWSGAVPFGASHIAAIAAFVAALAAWHYAWPAAKSGAVASGAILGVVALAASAYIVVSGGMRNAETAGGKAAAAAHQVSQRASLLQMRAEATYMLADCPAAAVKADRGVRCGLRAAMTAECASGKGKQCDGKAYSVRTYEAAIEGYDTKLARLGPVAEPNAGYLRAARALAALPFVTVPADALAPRLADVMPFLAVLVSEICVIGLLMYAVNGPGPTRQPDRSAEVMPPTVRPGPSERRTVRRGPSGKEACLAELVTMLALGQSVPSQRTLAEKWNRPKQTISDWLREWERAGLIPPRRTVGREKALAAS